jgi:TATA-box binding protein (TBP) (component of TFIID and TFIIIB)
MNSIKDNSLKQINTTDININKLEITGLPDGVKVATMCCSCFINTKINLDNIEKYLALNSDDILVIKKNKENFKTLIELKKPTKRNIIPKKKANGNNFYNSITLIIRVTSGHTMDLGSEPKINIKLFKNGSLQMSGCKTIYDVSVVLNKLISKLSQVKAKIEDDMIKQITFIETLNNITINNFKIDMIYCNYKISIQIDREKLYGLLKKKKVKCIYEPCIRACVIIKYVPENDNSGNKEVSIFIFKKGNIIITGARSKSQILESYNYINNIIITHSEEIIKKSDEDEEETILSLYKNVMKEVEQGLITI